MTIATGFTLHGVLPSANSDIALARLQERGHLEVALIEAGPLAAAVSIVSGATAASCGTAEADHLESDHASALALRHHAVLSAIAPVADIVPVRLGSMFSTRSAVTDLMMREQARFSSELFRLRGCVEMGFRVAIRDAIAHPQKLVGTSQDDPGQGYLRRQMTARMSSSAELQAQALAAHSAIESFIPHALDILPRTARPRKGERRVLSDIAVLIKREAVACFEGLARKHEADLATRGLHVSILGPWPAYSFVHAHTEGALSWAAH